MNEITKNKNSSNVDKSLVAMFLKMSPEEHLQMNDNSVCTILELSNAFKQQTKKTNSDSLYLKKHYANWKKGKKEIYFLNKSNMIVN